VTSPIDAIIHVSWSVLVVALAFGVIGAVLVTVWLACAILGTRRPRPVVNGRILPEVLD
jgi:hypothetical protein